MQNIYEALTSEINITPDSAQPIPETSNARATKKRSYAEQDEIIAQIASKKSKLTQIDYPTTLPSSLSLTALINSFLRHIKCEGCGGFNSNTKQCSEGHLFCKECVRSGMVYCRTCSRFLINCELNECRIAELIETTLKNTCLLCGFTMKNKTLENHLKYSCTKNITGCEFSYVGCKWLGSGSAHATHRYECDHRNTTAKEAMDILDNNMNAKNEMEQFQSLLDTVRSVQNGLRMISEKVLFTRDFCDLTDPNDMQICFVSELFEIPASSDDINRYYIEMYLIQTGPDADIQYFYKIKSCTIQKITVRFSLTTFKMEGSENMFTFTDVFHEVEFDVGKENESKVFEMKSLDCTSKHIEQWRDITDIEANILMLHDGKEIVLPLFDESYNSMSHIFSDILATMPQLSLTSWRSDSISFSSMDESN